MNKQWQSIIIATLLVVSFLWTQSPVSAHGGGGELVVSPAVAAPGGEIKLEGEGLEAGSELKITLQGVSFQAELGVVTVGDDEDFHETFTLPADVPPGVYQVQASSEDGDSYTTELTVEAGEAGHDESVAAAEPSAEPMQLDRSRSPLEWAIILLGVLGSAGLGALLLRQT